MADSPLLPRIDAVFRKAFPRHHGSVSLLTKTGDVAGWDSLNHVKLILMIEDEFDVKIKASEAINMMSVGKIYELVASKVGSKA